MGRVLEKQIQEMRVLLDELVSNSNAKLCEGKILEVSVQLDDLIATYYGESSF
jgi:hypothetical protein